MVIVRPKKILIINIFGIGDVLFTTPLVRNIKDNFPDAIIGYVANRRTESIVRNNPNINKVYVYERDDFNNAYKASKFGFIKKLRIFLDEIKKEKFDVVIDLSMNSQVSFLTSLIGIKKRIGFNYKNRSPYLTTKIPLKGYEDKHVVDYYSSLLKSIGLTVHPHALELYIDEDTAKWSEDWCSKSGIKGEDVLIGLVPGGGASWGKDAKYKRWSPENYAKLADKIIDKFKAEIILFGDASEEGLCSEVSNLMKHKPIKASGKLSLIFLTNGVVKRTSPIPNIFIINIFLGLTITIFLHFLDLPIILFQILIN